MCYSVAICAEALRDAYEEGAVILKETEYKFPINEEGH
jgi:hypothetical protein